MAVDLADLRYDPEFEIETAALGAYSVWWAHYQTGTRDRVSTY
jgi:hypothetical protein